MKIVNFPTAKYYFSEIVFNSPVGHFRNAEHLSVLSLTGVCVFPRSVADVQMLDDPGWFFLQAAERQRTSLWSS